MQPSDCKSICPLSMCVRIIASASSMSEIECGTSLLLVICYLYALHQVNTIVIRCIVSIWCRHCVSPRGSKWFTPVVPNPGPREPPKTAHFRCLLNQTNLLCSCLKDTCGAALPLNDPSDNGWRISQRLLSRHPSRHSHSGRSLMAVCRREQWDLLINISTTLLSVSNEVRVHPKMKIRPLFTLSSHSSL